MSNLISGKEALIALANGEEVEYLDSVDTFRELGWGNAMGLETNLFFGCDRYKFRLKPKTITLNGIEIPAPFEPKDGDTIYWYLTTNLGRGYDYLENRTGKHDYRLAQFGAWRTEDEIKRVVDALKSILKGD